MEIEIQPPERNPVGRMIHKLGEMAGVVKPDWMDEQTQSEHSEAELRLIRRFHDRGDKAFTFKLRSREMPIKTYRRTQKSSEYDAD